MSINIKQKTTISIGLVIIVSTVITWIFSGLEIFTKTKILIQKKDELFGTTFSVWQNKFIWGLDLTALFSGIIILGTLVFFFWFRNTSKENK